ncbi:hypothetical protein [Streptococcus macedonicus]
MIAAYEKAVQAMGERWGDDEFISFIELGGLGHWGEWHVDSTAGIRQLPDKSIRERYVTPWLSAFLNANLLMRRPFTVASENGLGLYNEMAGNQKATQDWLECIASGGVYSETGTSLIAYAVVIRAYAVVWRNSVDFSQLRVSHA